MDKPIAIISDIHSNLEALQSVMNDIESHGISKIICLGDIVGYGPNPEECIDIARKFDINILGNHDEGVLLGPVAFRQVARQALEWTSRQLRPSSLSPKSVKERWEFIEKLPTTYQSDNILYVHGSPRQPTIEYIFRSDCDYHFGENDKLAEIFSMIKHLCFIGHTHDPGIITDDIYTFLSLLDINYIYQVKEGQKLIVNVGSVGQSRDGDSRSCYVIFDGKTINYRRVPYDYHITRGKIAKISQLDKYLGERLALGR